MMYFWNLPLIGPFICRFRFIFGWSSETSIGFLKQSEGKEAVIRYTRNTQTGQQQNDHQFRTTFATNWVYTFSPCSSFSWSEAKSRENTMNGCYTTHWHQLWFYFRWCATRRWWEPWYSQSTMPAIYSFRAADFTFRLNFQNGSKTNSYKRT